MLNSQLQFFKQIKSDKEEKQRINKYMWKVCKFTSKQGSEN